MTSATPSVAATSGQQSARWPYWLVTGLLVVYIAFGALFDVAKHPEAVAGIQHLGYPEYVVRYIGV